MITTQFDATIQMVHKAVRERLRPQQNLKHIENVAEVANPPLKLQKRSFQYVRRLRSENMGGTGDCIEQKETFQQQLKMNSNRYKPRGGHLACVGNVITKIYRS